MRDLRPLVRVAQTLADETRLRLLAALLDGDATVSDLVTRLGLSQSRVSTHLARLREAGMVTVQANGRQRVYHADGERVGALLAALGGPAAARPPRRSAQAARQVQRDTAIRRARSCYDHLAGVTGVELLDALLARGWLVRSGTARPAYALTEAGARALADRGVDVAQARRARRAFALACLDWTERRPHLAGALGAEVLRALERGGIAHRDRHTRIVRPTGSIAAWLDAPPAR